MLVERARAWTVSAWRADRLGRRARRTARRAGCGTAPAGRAFGSAAIWRGDRCAARWATHRASHVGRCLRLLAERVGRRLSTVGSPAHRSCESVRRAMLPTAVAARSRLSAVASSGLRPSRVSSYRLRPSSNRSGQRGFVAVARRAAALKRLHETEDRRGGVAINRHVERIPNYARRITLSRDRPFCMTASCRSCHRSGRRISQLNIQRAEDGDPARA